MSLLDATNEWVCAYPEVVTTDSDGNTVVGADLGDSIYTRARIWPLSSTETPDVTVTRFGLRFPRSFPHVLGPKSQVDWNGKRYSVVGDPVVHNGSSRTRNIQYILERS